MLITDMGKKSRAQLIRRVREVESQRTRLVRQLARPDALIIGSLHEVNRRCGKPSCHCATGPGHPQPILMSTRQGRRRCQLVRQADLAAVEEAVETYRQFRRALRLLSTLDSKILALLRELMRLRDQGYR